MNPEGKRKLDLSDMGIEDEAMKIVVKIIIKSPQTFSQLNLSKNIFRDEGLKMLALFLKDDQSFMHVDVSGNSITQEGSEFFFEQLAGQVYLTSLVFANKDCKGSKIKMGLRGAVALKQTLSRPECLISHLDLTHN